MKRRRADALAALLATLAALLPGGVAAQSLSAQPHLYLLTTEAFDARALWIQPAGLAARPEASLSGLITASTSGRRTVTQYGLTLASRGIGLGWQHDRLPDGSSDNQWAVGLAGGTARFTAGVARRWIRGDSTNAAAFDAGVRYGARPSLEVSLVWRDIGSPVVRDTTVRATLVPGIALALFRARAQIGADWEIVTRGWGTSALRAGAAVALPLQLALSLRADFSGSLHARGLALALTWNPAGARVTAFASRPAGDGTDQAGAWLSAVQRLGGPRRRF